MKYHKCANMEEPDFLNQSFYKFDSIDPTDETLFYEKELFVDSDAQKESALLRHMRLMSIYTGATYFLTKNQLKTFTFHFLNGLSVTEIARKLKYSKTAVTLMLSQVIQRLRRKLKIFYLDKRTNPGTGKNEYAVVMGDCTNNKVEDCRVVQWMGSKRPKLSALKRIENRYYEPYKYGRFRKELKNT